MIKLDIEKALEQHEKQRQALIEYRMSHFNETTELATKTIDELYLNLSIALLPKAIKRLNNFLKSIK